MIEHETTPDYKRHRFPPEIIGHAVWLYFRFALSYRDVEELLAERGVIITYESVRQWCRKFGQGYANDLRHRRPRPGDKWHLDEVFIAINGVQHYLALSDGSCHQPQGDVRTLAALALLVRVPAKPPPLNGPRWGSVGPLRVGVARQTGILRG